MKLKYVVGLSFFLLLQGTWAQTSGPTGIKKRPIYALRSVRLPEDVEEAVRNAGITQGTVLVGLVRDRMCTIKQRLVIRGLGYGVDEVALRSIDRKFEDAMTANDFPCGADTVIVPVSFRFD